MKAFVKRTDVLYGLIRNYISPAIGSMKLTEITSRVLEKFYMNLLKTKAVLRITDRKGAKVTRYVTPSTVRKIHNLLKSCFHQAVQGDSGHAQAKMVTDQYSHILDDGRKENASHSN